MSRADRARWTLAAILLAALAARLWAIDFGLPHVLVRPDELYILGTVIRMHGGQPNPGFWDYGGLYMYFVAGVYALYYGVGLLAGWFSDSASFVKDFSVRWDAFFLIPRITSAVMGAGTAALVYMAGRELLERTTALVSALFAALAFLHVRDSHYATTDVFMTFFLVAALVAAIRVDRSRASSDAWLAGALAGCAVATKYNSVFIVLVLGAVEARHLWEGRGDWRRALRTTQVFRMAAACIFLFAVTNPYLFLDWERARANLEALRASSAGGMTPPEWLGRGWTYHVPYSLRYGLGLPMLVSALAGMLWMGVRHRRAAFVLAIFPVAYYVFIGEAYNVFVRYMVPVVPFLCLFAGYAVAELARVTSALSVRLSPSAMATGLALLTVAPSAWSIVQFDLIAARDDNRIVAAEWVWQNVPEGSVILMGGNRYGHPQIERGTVPRYTRIEFDRRMGVFQRAGRPSNARPDWVIIQQHPIPYATANPKVLEVLAEGFELVHTIRAFDPAYANVYDIQDGFYAPFGGFKGVRRFGPNYEIYRRR